MSRTRFAGSFTIALAAVFVGGIALPARAGLGGQLLRGLTNTLSPTVGTVQNGPNFNNNDFSQRINRDYLTDGYSYEFFRLFGTDTYGDPETLNLGLLNLELSEPTGSGLRGAGVYSRIGFNQRIVPEVYWDARTAGRNISSFAGSAPINTPLQYSIDTNIGVERMQINGQIQLESSGSVNTLGFYDAEFTLSNTGTAVTSGLLDERTEDISFDVGPIDVSGNVVIDTTMAMLQGLGQLLGGGSDESPLPPALRPRTADEIASAIEAGESISMAEFNTLLSAYAADPTSVTLPQGSGPYAGDLSGQNPVPEPGTLMLVLAAATLAVPRRRRSIGR